MLLLALMWGLSIPVTKLGLQDLPPLTLTALRFAFAVPLMLLFTLGRQAMPLRALPKVAAGYGFPPAESFTPTRWLQGGDTVQVGQEAVQVLHCPGHTPGHVVFYVPSMQHAFVGDVLFAGSIGRTDFPQGDHAQLIRSITQQLWPLGDATTFTSGHGPESTFGHERRTNPFVRGT